MAKADCNIGDIPMQSGFWIFLRWGLRVLFPMFPIGIKFMLLDVADNLTWPTATGGLEFLVFSMTVSITSLADLIILSQRVYQQRWSWYTPTLMIAFLLVFAVALIFRTTYTMAHMANISDVGMLYAIRKAECAGLWLAGSLLLLSILTLLLEWYGRLPAWDPTESFKTVQIQ